MTEQRPGQNEFRLKTYYKKDNEIFQYSDY